MTERDFGTLPVGRIFARLAVPNILANLFSTFYMIADGIFVGRFLGPDALAAVNLIWPLLSIGFALSDMVAVGSSVKVATALGAGEEDRARRLFSAGSLIPVLIGLFFLVTVTPFLEPLVGFFIRDPVLAGLAARYARWFLISYPLIMPLFALDNFLRISGKSNYSMAVNVAVSLLNIFLDWLLIARLGLDIRAAAAASVFSMLAGVLLSLLPFLFRRVTLVFRVPRVPLKELWGILYNGSSEFFANITGSLMSLVINSLLLRLGGGPAVAAYSVVMYLDSLLMGVLYALGDSLQPAISYNVGAGKLPRTRRFFRLGRLAAAGVSLVCLAVMLLFPRPLSAAFTGAGNPQLLALSVRALLLFAPSYLFKWFTLLSSLFLTALDKPGTSILIMTFNALICPALSLLLLAPLWQVDGVFLAHSLSAALAFLAALLLWKRAGAGYTKSNYSEESYKKE